MHGVPFDYSSLRTFGHVCFVLLPNHEKNKLSSKTSRCIFVGYSSAHKGYRCYDPITKRLRIDKHVSFLENVPYYQSKLSPQNISFLQPPETLPILTYAPHDPPPSEYRAPVSDPAPAHRAPVSDPAPVPFTSSEVVQVTSV